MATTAKGDVAALVKAVEQIAKAAPEALRLGTVVLGSDIPARFDSKAVRDAIRAVRRTPNLGGALKVLARFAGKL